MARRDDAFSRYYMVAANTQYYRGGGSGTVQAIARAWYPPAHGTACAEHLPDLNTDDTCTELSMPGGVHVRVGSQVERGGGTLRYAVHYHDDYLVLIAEFSDLGSDRPGLSRLPFTPHQLAELVCQPAFNINPA